MRLSTRAGLLIFALTLGSGCAAKSEAMPAMSPASVAMSREAAPEAAGAPAPAIAAAATAPGSAPAKAAIQGKTAPDEPKMETGQQPLLIYEGALGLELPKEDFAASIEKIIDAAEAAGGFLLARNDQSVQIRVPSRSFRETLKNIGNLGHVTRRSVTAQDVSEEYNDLEVRLKNLESVRDRLEQFLTRTKNVDEALRVGKELETVALRIDEIKGRMKFLQARAAYSLISVTLTPKPVADKVVVRDPTPPPPKPIHLPVKWLGEVGIDQLTNLE